MAGLAVAPQLKSVPRASTRRVTVRSSQALLLGLLLLVALGARVYRLSDPPIDFHPSRQYHSVVLAHWLYVQSLPSVPDWELATARETVEPLLEPPIMEVLAWFEYRLAGAEYLWLPRLLASVFWLTGGLFLYRLVREFESRQVAIVAVAIYLFLPFGILASRSFQPDPLMLMLMIAALWAIFRYHARPSPKRLAWATAVAAAALFAKPQSVFFVYFAFGALALRRLGMLRAITSREVYFFGILSLLPILLYTIYGLFIGDFFRGQEEGRFVPHLLLSRFFWDGWRDQVADVVGHRVGLALLLAALAGTLLGQGAPRALLLGLWAGYVAYCLFFTIHTPTHNYYHLPLIPIVALAITPLAARLSMQRGGRVVAPAIVSALVIWGLATEVRVVDEASRPSAQPQIRFGPLIGEQVGHSTKTMLLGDVYSLPVRYYGKLSGISWPNTYDLMIERTQGLPSMPAEERFELLKQTLVPDYFIVTWLEDLNAQPDLRSFLEKNFPVLVQTDDYIIFDLRERNAQEA